MSLITSVVVADRGSVVQNSDSRTMILDRRANSVDAIE